MRWANVGFGEWCFTPAPKSFRMPPTCMACHCHSFGQPPRNDGALLSAEFRPPLPLSGSKPRFPSGAYPESPAGILFGPFGAIFGAGRPPTADRRPMPPEDLHLTHPAQASLARFMCTGVVEHTPCPALRRDPAVLRDSSRSVPGLFVAVSCSHPNNTSPIHRAGRSLPPSPSSSC